MHTSFAAWFSQLAGRVIVKVAINFVCACAPPDLISQRVWGVDGRVANNFGSVCVFF
jgi:hypothetical protein